MFWPEGAPFVIRAGGRRCAVAGAGPVWPGEETGDLVDGVTVPELLEHSVVGGPSEVGDSSVDIVTDSEPIEHSVVVRGPNDVGNGYVDVMAVPDLIEHSGLRETAVVQSRRNSESSRDWEEGRQDHMCNDNTTLDIRMEDQRLSLEEDEAIVVGAVGSVTPWFLTGWADEVEIEFMIDTGCQVTILAASVFERMCASVPQVRARLGPCGRRLVSADSSPLSVKGEI